MRPRKPDLRCPWNDRIDPGRNQRPSPAGPNKPLRLSYTHHRPRRLDNRGAARPPSGGSTKGPTSARTPHLLRTATRHLDCSPCGTAHRAPVVRRSKAAHRPGLILIGRSRFRCSNFPHHRKRSARNVALRPSAHCTRCQTTEAASAPRPSHRGSCWSRKRRRRSQAPSPPKGRLGWHSASRHARGPGRTRRSPRPMDLTSRFRGRSVHRAKRVFAGCS